MTEATLTTLKERSVLSEEKLSSFFLHTVVLMLRREWRRLMMEPSRVFGVVLQPLVFLMIFGLGFHDSFSLPGKELSYIEFFFPGILALVILFSSIYATLTLVEDKKCGFFRLVLVGPGGVVGAIFGKIVATASLGIIQGLVFIPVVVLLPISLSAIGLLWLLIFLVFGSICFAIVGVVFAWICETASAFHGLMSVILIPMWLLSGAMFPIDKGPLFWLSFINPMAYLVNGLRGAVLSTTNSPWASLGFIIAFATIAYVILLRMLNNRSSKI